MTEMARRKQIFTAAQVGSLLDDDTECIFSGSYDDFDADPVKEFDPPEREQGIILYLKGKV